MPGAYSLLYTESAGNTILASRRNQEHQQHIDKMEPQYMDDYSANVSTMRTTEDPGEDGAESLASTLQGEITRIRHAILEVKQSLDSSLSYWYETPTNSGAVSGPSASTDNTIPRFDGTTGKIVQDSLITVSDQDEVNIPVTTVTTSSANTTFTSTTVVDGTAWDLSAVKVGDVLTASGGSTGEVTVIDDGADTLTTASWVGGTPSSTETVAVSRPGKLTNAGISQLDGATNITGAATLTGDVTIGDGTGTGTTPDLTINNNTGDATIRLQVNNSSAAAWDIYNDNSDSDWLKVSKAGVDAAQVVPGASLITLDANNVSSASTPRDNTLYSNMIPKAWALTNSSAAIQDGVNLTCAAGATGVFDYTFRNNMASANYCVVTTVDYTGTATATVLSKTTSGFTLQVRIATSALLADLQHNVLVFGEQ